MCISRWIAAIAWCSLAAASFAEETCYFRHQSGVADPDDKPLPANFDGQRATLVWKAVLLPGHSSPCVSGDAVYVTTYDASKTELATVALDRATGAERWRRVAPAENIEPHHATGSPAVATPACDGERVFAFFGSYGLLCYDLHGKLLWSRPMGPFQDEFGASSSPVLVDGKVILNEDHDIDSHLIAVDADTGEVAWRAEREGFTRSYSTPVIWRESGQEQIIVAGSLQLVAYSPDDGRKLWSVDGLSRIVDTTPVVAEGQVFVATWTPGGDPSSRISMEPFDNALKSYDKNGDRQVGQDELPAGEVRQRFFRIDLNQDQRLDRQEWEKHARVFERAQNAALAVRPGAESDSSAEVAWTFDRGLPTVPSPVVYRGVLYMVKDGGIITSLDASTGKLLQQGRAEGRGNYYSSLVAGDGKVYLASESGVVTILQAGSEWKILGSHDFGERMMATPALVDGRIYLRTEAALYCFEAK